MSATRHVRAVPERAVARSGRPSRVIGGALVIAALALPSHAARAQDTAVVAPTASIAGCVQVVARILETGLHKMDALGFDITRS